MHRLAILLTLYSLLLVSTAGAQTLADKVQEHRLDNGLTLLLVERHDSPTIAAYITFKVGGANESSEHRGVAHLLEHMLFKGTKTLGTSDYQLEKPLLVEIEQTGHRIDMLKNHPDADPKELQQLREKLSNLQQDHRQLVIKDEFSKIYAENGGVGYNAFTSKDQTSYLINLPANKLELWAAIEADRLQNAVLREFYTEREVVREERRRSYESSPKGKLYETMLAAAYKVHPYRNPVIGWDSDIDNLTLAETRSFLRKYYSPVNMIITLVGDFDSAETLALIKRYFGQVEPGIPVPPVVEREPEQAGERRLHVTFDAQPQLMIAYHKPTMPHPDDFAFDLLMQVLTEGRTSRLYRSLVVEKQLATSASAYGAPGSRYDNLMILSISPSHQASLIDIENEVYQQLERLKTEPISDAELEKAKRQILTSMLRHMKGNSGLARTLSSYEVLGGWRYLVDYEENLDAITSDQLMAAAKRYLTAENRTIATIGREALQ